MSLPSPINNGEVPIPFISDLISYLGLSSSFFIYPNTHSDCVLKEHQHIMYTLDKQILCRTYAQCLTLLMARAVMLVCDAGRLIGHLLLNGIYE